MKRATGAPSKPTEEVRLEKMRSIVQFFGMGLWKGDLSEMRADIPDGESDQRKQVESL
jgi:hypothetical protein